VNDGEVIKSWFAEKNFHIDEAQIAKFLAYLDMIRQAAQRMNLVSKNDLPHIFERHLLDSLQALAVIEFPSYARVADLGSGAGFPGIPIAIARQDIDMTLIESRRLKALFLKSVCEKLNLENCSVRHDRWENINSVFDFILARAVYRESLLEKVALPKLNPGGAVVYYRKFNDIKILRKSFT
jgi:16S rRNA (guanine527-N7)-methyltransferase